MKESAKTFVLDAEAVAFDIKEGKLLPFQELSKRKRKDVKVEDIQVRVHLFVFDILYLNGEVSLSGDVCPVLSGLKDVVAATAETPRGKARDSARALSARLWRV